MNNVIEILEVLKWPLVLFAVFLVLRKPIISLINRITSVGFGDKTFETTKQLAAEEKNKREWSKVERALGLFREETVEMFEGAIKQETEYEQLQSEQEKVDRLKNYSTILYIIKHFETIYSSIFGSQLRILEQLNTLNPETRKTLKRFYDSAKKLYPDLYNKYSYEDYLEFLFSYNLIREDNGQIRLTILGVDFLKFIAETNKNVNKIY